MPQSEAREKPFAWQPIRIRFEVIDMYVNIELEVEVLIKLYNFQNWYPYITQNTDGNAIHADRGWRSVTLKNL